MPTIEDIALHVKTYRSALKSTHEITINSLTNSHIKVKPILHPLADSAKLDIDSLIYSLLRLPSQIDRARLIVTGQIPDVFTLAGFALNNWTKISAPARRRTTYLHPKKHTIACYIASISDIDDLTNLLIAHQLEINKLHVTLKKKFPTLSSLNKSLDNAQQISRFLDIKLSDWAKLISALGNNWKVRLRRFYKHRLNLRLRLLAGSWVSYTKATQKWWKNIAKTVSKYNQEDLHISRLQLYFVSSNTHSLLNLFTGFPLSQKANILKFVKKNQTDLYQIWQRIQTKEHLIHPNDFLYFAFKYLNSNPATNKLFRVIQKKLHIINVPSAHYLDLNTQLFPIKNLLESKHLDPRLVIKKPAKIKNSQAYIFNIDYPLGFAAYHVLNETLENTYKIKGVYITGKAAVLNSEIGDIQIPRLVFDEHSQNTYMFSNCFNKFFPFVNQQGSILTNQKSATVLGTYLENKLLLKKYMENNLTIIEMESGPYLGAIAEATYDSRLPTNTIVDLNNAPFDIVIINYTSDTPYSKTKNLGHLGLNLKGVEPVYLSSLAILQRIINLEESL